MKKVLIANRNLKRKSSGIPRIVHHQISIFNDLGYKVYVLCEKINRKEIKTSGGIGFKVFLLPLLNSFQKRLFFNWQVRLIEKWLNPDLVIGHGDIFSQNILFIHNCVHLAFLLTYR